ncbi:2'-5' RNA ligase [Aquimarina sp. EL_43]|uniref:2'-5' RNA ligase family protein n=1 Tax=unclassified Aquimarina TaxID=2627091 RepID=UPI0018CA06D7|nr:MULTISPECIES: 2'-5' RNA ligase family protein [unclassified Aquimarina]MBG6129221.1 2'-5' RNA ligase [Aquimarina sp. EL_35]MBG6150286.1 2'-5' RNA ligase [Aquimarina sp. EL_32]MBG6167028.1 2'-5' RNA ligase [Aquimarina sp. EL_43]
MAYLVLAYPEIKNADFDVIQNYRKENDQLFYHVVKPHFTIVFPVFDQTEIDFIAEIKKQAATCNSFDFVLRCATINKDAFNEYYHTFLVPDQGYSNIVKIHDKLYSGTLKENHRLDLDFIPHIGIGNSLNKLDCKKMVDEWNKDEFEIIGTVKTLTIAEYDNNNVRKVEEIKL